MSKKTRTQLLNKENFLNYVIDFDYRGSIINIQVCENDHYIFTGYVCFITKEFKFTNETKQMREISFENFEILIDFIKDYSQRMFDEHDKNIKGFLTEEENREWEAYVRTLDK